MRCNFKTNSLPAMMLACALLLVGCGGVLKEEVDPGFTGTIEIIIDKSDDGTSGNLGGTSGGTTGGTSGGTTGGTSGGTSGGTTGGGGVSNGDDPGDTSGFNPVWPGSGNAWIPYEQDRTIYVMNVDGTDKRALASDGRWPSLSQDHSKLVFLRRRQIILKDATGTETVVYEASSGTVGSPCITPDGKKIYFDLGSSVARINTDGTNLTTVATADMRICCPSVAPSGQAIAYMRLPSNRPESQVWTSDASGDGLVQVTPEEWACLTATWSPNSQGLIFTGGKSGAHKVLRIKSANTFGLGADIPITGLPDGSVLLPCITPDGEWIFFSTTNRKIYRVHSSGGPVQLMAEGATNNVPVF